MIDTSGGSPRIAPGAFSLEGPNLSELKNGYDQNEQPDKHVETFHLSPPFKAMTGLIRAILGMG